MILGAMIFVVCQNGSDVFQKAGDIWQKNCEKNSRKVFLFFVRLFIAMRQPETILTR